MSDLLDKISKLLTQAERTDNEHERDAFITRAQTLATEAQIDLAVARQHTARKEQREQPVQQQINIGSRGQYGNAKMAQLCIAIAGHNDVQVNIAHDSTYIIAFGFPSDIEVVEALYTSLVVQMVAAANAAIAAGKHREETQRVFDYRRGEYINKPTNAKAFRFTFYDHFTYAISARLRDARKAAIDATAVVETEEGATTSGALVLLGKEVEVRDFYKATSTARGTWRGGRRTSNSHSRAGADAGRAAGERANLGLNKAIA